MSTKNGVLSTMPGEGCIFFYILNKSENTTLLLLVKMAEKRFLFQFLFLSNKMKSEPP